MKCPRCKKQIGREIHDPTGAHGIEKGDTVLAKSLVVVKSNGHVELKCPGCGSMVPVKMVPVFGKTPVAGKLKPER